MMRRDTYNNIVKAARLLSLVVLMAFGAGLKGWGQTSRVDESVQPAHEITEDLYVVPGQDKTVSFQASGENPGIDGYVRWYTQIGEEDQGTSYLRNSQSFTRYENGYVWYRGSGTNYSNTSIIFNASADDISKGITLVYDASSVIPEYDRSTNTLTPRSIGIRHKYIIKNAKERAEKLDENRRNIQNLDLSEYLNALAEVSDKSLYVLNSYDIYVPKGATTNFRLPENIGNYYVGNTSSVATQVRYSVSTYDGNSWSEISQSTARSPYILRQSFADNNIQKAYILTEVRAGNSGYWYPVSFMNVTLIDNAEPLTADALKQKYESDNYAYQDRYEEYLEKNEQKYQRLVYIPFEEDNDIIKDNTINILKENLPKNFSDSPFSINDEVVNSYYAFSYPSLFQNKESNRLRVAKGEYALFRTLNYPGISDEDVRIGGSNGGQYNDWFITGNNSYHRTMVDRRWEKTASADNPESGYFMYMDASETPGVITKLPINGICPNTALIVNAWICDMSWQTTTTVSLADVGFTLKRKNKKEDGTEDGTETILAKYYSGTLPTIPRGQGSPSTNPSDFAKWQQVSFKFSFSNLDVSSEDEYILEISSNCQSSTGADFAIDDISIYRTLPNIVVQREDACDASTLTVSSDYATLLRNLAWTEGEDIPDTELIRSDPSLVRYRLGMNGPDPTNMTHDNHIGNAYFSFIEGLKEKEDGSIIAGEDVTGNNDYDTSIPLVEDGKYRWVRINKNLTVDVPQSMYSFRVIVSTNQRTDPKFPTNRDDAEKMERILNLRVAKDYNYLVDNWEKEFQNTPKPDWLKGTVDLGILTEDNVNSPENVGTYTTVIEALYSQLQIPRIRCSWLEGDKLYLYPMSVDNTDLRYKDEVIRKDDGTSVTASGIYHVILFSALQVEHNTERPVNVSDRCNMMSSFTVQPSLIITVGTETDADALVCAGTERKISAKLQGKDGSELPSNVDYSFDWFLSSLEDYHEIAINEYDIKGAIDYFRKNTQYKAAFTRTDVEGWETNGVAEVQIKEGLIQLFKDNLLVTDKKEFSIILNSDKIVAIPFVKTGTIDNTVYCTEIIEVPFLQYTDNVPKVHPGFPNYSYPAEITDTPVRIGLRHIKNGETLTVKLREKINFSINNEAAKSHVLKEKTDEKDKIVLLYDLEGNLPPLGIVEDFFAVNEGVENYLKIKFDSEDAELVNINEGQEYILLIPFAEYENKESEFPIATACDGLAQLRIKIVPEYLTWKGDGSAVWYNDDNWHQSTEEELYMNDKTPGQDANGDDEITNAFAPLYFTKITLPEGQELSLLNPTYVGANDKTIGNLGDGYTIQYDMAVDTVKPIKEGDKGSITVVPYYINKVEQIYFKPYALLKNQQYLNYEKAWVEFEMEKGKKYWLSSPLKDVFAGDMYAPTVTGRQTTPAFTDITYTDITANGNYDRWDPAFYQKAWDKGITYYTNTVGTESETVSAVQSNWSIEYNDVNVPYSLGKGFYASVEGEFTGDNNNEVALVRLPKSDKSYSYYETRAVDVSSIEGRQYAGKMAGRDAITVTLTDDDDVTVNANPDGDGKHFLLGNPYMYPLNMEAFFNGNQNDNIDLFERKYWVLNNGVQDAVVVGTPDIGFGENTGAINSLGQIPPMTAFFVELKDSLNETTSSVDIKFTTSMMANAVETSSVETKSLTASNPILTLTAERGETRSVARLLTSDKGHDAYEASEDAVILLDSELDAPMVYTVAGDVAAQFNTMQSIKNVPVGVYNKEGDEVTLTISGLSRLVEPLYLYDAWTGKSKELTGDSYQLTVEGESLGRYYLRNEALASELESTISIYSLQPGEIVAASSGAALRQVRVYSVNGELVTQRSAVGQTACRLSVPRGAIYMIYAEDTKGNSQSVKLRVR